MVEYTQDSTGDMLQIGRWTESSNFVVAHTVPGSQSNSGTETTENTSIVTCCVICEWNLVFTAGIYAAGFDSSNNIFAGKGLQMEDV